MVGTATILSVEDTARSEDLNTALRCSYGAQPHGGEVYQLTDEMALPANVIRELKNAVGKIVPAKIHPEDKNKVRLSLE